MDPKQRAWPALIALIAVAAGIGWIAWTRHPREFRGVLEFTPDRVGIPEGPPPPVAYLVTPTERHPLALPGGSLREWDCPWRGLLQDLNGKQGVVRGAWRSHQAMNQRGYRRLHVYELRSRDMP